jgi:tetratricopeptide (TPR) repeat protein
MPPTLRLTQTDLPDDRFRVEVALEGDGQPRLASTVEFAFRLTEQEQRDVRWYLEDYLQHPLDPAPTIASRIETRMNALGRELYEHIFEGNRDVRRLWDRIHDNLNNLRVEIITGVQEATAIPWELLREPADDAPLALSAQSFVRTQANTVRRARLPDAGDGKIRILLVICRPKGRNDVPFRSVASRILKGLSAEARALFQLDVLRPATYEALTLRLREAKAAGMPYHVVHFDGHGTYEDMSGVSLPSNALRYAGQGKQGFLIFEDEDAAGNLRAVDGTTLGALLYETDVPVLVLNACQSAYAEPPEAPETPDTPDDQHAEVRAFGSLAQQVIDKGVAGVVAMRYSVYVVTAAQFVADLYRALVQGQPLGQAVTLGRKQLAADPFRSIGYQPIKLQDWVVPVVYEAAPITLFPKPAQPDTLTIDLSAATAAPAQGGIDPALPRQPDLGFFGRDETLLALDRAFDKGRIVLLHAYAGNGKTTTAAEFARWYALTGGVRGPVIFTTLEHYKPLPRVLDDFGKVFAPILERINVHWDALEDNERRHWALETMKQIEVLWIWDNVETVAGFPIGTESAWEPEEQRALADFLRDARETQAKFLLTSRREERGWLGDLPTRIEVPPMPMQERVEMAKEIARRHRHQLADVEDWRPLLRFTGGNPLTLTVLVSQALRGNITTKEKISKFVEDLRAGAAAIDDDIEQGRSKSLAATLQYGVERGFSDEDKRILALLHLFQCFVDTDVLRFMGRTDQEWTVESVRGKTNDELIALLDRAADAGLLTSAGRGYYTIHPALPWYFRRLFEGYYDEAARGQATHAYVEAVSYWGNEYATQIIRGQQKYMDFLEAEEDNLLAARRLARANGWWDSVIRTMQGLEQIYDRTGRRAEWRRLVEEVTPDFANSVDDSPLPGREEGWGFISAYRVRLALAVRDLAWAERLQRARIAFDRERAAPLLAGPTAFLDDKSWLILRTLATSAGEMGRILYEQGKAESADFHQEAYDLLLRIDDKQAAAIAVFNLGHAYKDLPALHNLDEAERHYCRSLELRAEGDHVSQAKSLMQIGSIAYARFREGRDASKPEGELLKHLNEALAQYQRALGLLPDDAFDDLGVAHNQLGLIYQGNGQIDRSVSHYREAIHYDEMQGNYYGAAQTRQNVAVTLGEAGRLDDALLYAQAALKGFQHYGDRAADMVQLAQGLIAQIEAKIEKRKGGV